MTLIERLEQTMPDLAFVVEEFEWGGGFTVVSTVPGETWSIMVSARWP